MSMSIFGWALGTWIAGFAVCFAIALRDLRWTLLIPVGAAIIWMT